jgi:hydroxymethylglutaryl-CoA reductase
MMFHKSFSKFTREQRLAYLEEKGLLTKTEINFLNHSVQQEIIHLSERFVENVIGCFPLPLGIVPAFVMDKKEYTVPMVIEETSVVAAIGKTMKWIKQTGEIYTAVQGQDIIGQIQFPVVHDFSACEKKIEEHAEELITSANKLVVPNLVARGGGVNYLRVRRIEREDGKTMAVVHIYMHPCDAMGANLINQVCEFLRHPLESLIDAKANMCILSNLVDSKLTEATIVIRNVEKSLAEKITEASLFAHKDRYRAATHNKGVMNGIDAVLIATGNDWRAVEAGVHAYAARSGQYQSITQWSIEGKDLIGKIIAPIIVGTVGGVTQLHPTVKLSLKLLGIQKSEELSRICASVGLVQNLAAMRALTEEGIVKGHMKLHIDNLLSAADASIEEQKILKPLAEQFLEEKNKITQSDINDLLKQWRGTHDA